MFRTCSLRVRADSPTDELLSLALGDSSPSSFVSARSDDKRDELTASRVFDQASMEEAATMGYTELLRDMLDAGLAPSKVAQRCPCACYYDCGARNPTLVTVVLQGHTKTLQLLLERSVFAVDTTTNTPISSEPISGIEAAAHHGDTAAVELFLEHNSKRCYMALSVALKEGDVHTTEAILAARRSTYTAEYMKEKGVRFVNDAVRGGDVGCVSALLTGPGGKVFGSAERGEALCLAASQGKPAMVAALLRFGADANKQYRFGKQPTSAMCAAAASPAGPPATDVLELLLAKGASLEVLSGGKTPLWIAASKGRTSTTEWLLANGAKVERKCERMNRFKDLRKKSFFCFPNYLITYRHNTRRDCTEERPQRGCHYPEERDAACGKGEEDA